MSMKPQSANQIQNFLSLAQEDYLAARHLLIHGMLPQGCSLAATAIEKYLKAIASMKGFRTKKHLDSPLLNFIQQTFPALYARLDQDFIKFLSRCYNLRYAPIDGTHFSLIINQYKTLAALDLHVAAIDSGIVGSHDNKEGTPLRRAIKQKNKELINLNVAVGEMSQDELFTLQNKVYEIRVGTNQSVFTATYDTVAVNTAGPFCKKPDLPDAGKMREKAQFQLSRG